MLQLAHVVAGVEHATARDVVQSRDQVAHRRLTCARRPNESRKLAALDREAEAAQGSWGLIPRVGVAEHHLVELDAAKAVSGNRVRIRSIGYCRSEVEVFEDAGEQRARGLQVEGHPQQTHEREHQSRLHGGERDDRSGRDGHAVEHQPRPCQIDDGGDDRQKDAHQRKEPLATHLLPHLQADLVLVLSGVAGGLSTLLIEALRQQNAADAQRLLRDRRHLAERLLRLGGDARAHLPDPALGDHEHRQEHNRHQGQLPTEHEHAHERGDHRHGVADDARDRIAQHTRDTADVVGEP